MHILVSRPEPGASRTAERLAALGHTALVDTMLQVEATGAPLPQGPFDAVAFTSVNGARFLAGTHEIGALTHLPAFAVGTRTAEAARSLGFRAVTDCAGDARALAARLAADLPSGARILHATGEARAADLGAALENTGRTVHIAALYRTVPARTLSAATAEALATGRLDAALHYSPRTAASLVACVEAAGLMEPLSRLRHVCLSDAVAAPLRMAGLAAETAAAPNEDALLAVLAEASAAGGPPHRSDATNRPW